MPRYSELPSKLDLETQSIERCEDRIDAFTGGEATSAVDVIQIEHAVGQVHADPQQ